MCNTMIVMYDIKMTLYKVERDKKSDKPWQLVVERERSSSAMSESALLPLTAVIIISLITCSIYISDYIILYISDYIVLYISDYIVLYISDYIIVLYISDYTVLYLRLYIKYLRLYIIYLRL